MLLDALRRNPKMAGALIPLVAAVVGLQASLDRPDMRRQPAIEPLGLKNVAGGTTVGQALPFEYTLAALTGFRQVIAGLLWVRTDAFFHSGNYEAILPMIRLITWLDPNWLDVYATGAWHLMYNFTDTDQRSDRRYLPVGLALLDEGIANNPDVYDIYKEKGWNLFDKVKDYPNAAEAYEGALVHDKKADVSQVVHPMAHSYERAGEVDKAIEAWQKAVAMHQAKLKAAGPNSDDIIRNTMGLSNSFKNLSLLTIRKAVRPGNIQQLGPVDANFHFKVVRTAPRVLEITGTFNCEGTIKDNFDAGVFEADGVHIKTIGKGILLAGPVDGARVDVRLQDEGYEMPKLSSFSFEVDPSLTIMQDTVSVKGGKDTQPGSLFVVDNRTITSEPMLEAARIYPYKTAEAGALKGVPVAEALRGAAPISPLGQWQLVSLSYPKPQMGPGSRHYTQAEVPALFARLKSDTAAIARLSSHKMLVARAASHLPGKFKRAFDMSKDPKMYSFTQPSYDLIVSFNPRNTSDFIQDRIGWNGEGLTDKQFLDVKPGMRMLRALVKLKREDILGSGEKVLFEK